MAKTAIAAAEPDDEDGAVEPIPIKIVGDGGEVIETTLADVDQVILAQLNMARMDLANAEKELRKARRRIRALEAEREQERLDYPERHEIEEIFAEWQEVCGKHRSKLTADRFDAIRGMVEMGYSRREFTLAIAGAAYDPFTTEARNGRKIVHNDIELICREGKKFEAFANKAPRDLLALKHEREGTHDTEGPSPSASAPPRTQEEEQLPPV